MLYAREITKKHEEINQWYNTMKYLKIELMICKGEMVIVVSKVMHVIRRNNNF
ncbi:MAG: hypothetical protein ACLTAI_13795 [Thomasclavelia sp.]